MNYPEFFAKLSDQCQRFAPGVDVPEEFSGALDVLCSASRLADIDQPLREAFRVLLGPVYASVLSQAKDDAVAIVRERLGLLASAKATLEAERKSELEAAQARQVEREAQLLADQKKLQEMSVQIAALTQRLAELGK